MRTEIQEIRLRVSHRKGFLYTDDTFTLALHNGLDGEEEKIMESTPALLRFLVSPGSLRRITLETGDQNERVKAGKALSCGISDWEKELYGGDTSLIGEMSEP